MKTTHKKSMFCAKKKNCTLLVPEFLFYFYEEISAQFANKAIVFKTLLYRFSGNQSRIDTLKVIASTSSYQEEGLDLQRIDFRPDDEDWIKLKLLASAHNLSMCAFFVLLLRLEAAGGLTSGDVDGVPAVFPKITLLQSISSHNPPDFTRILHLRI